MGAKIDIIKAVQEVKNSKGFQENGFFGMKRYCRNEFELSEYMQLVEALGRMHRPEFVIDVNNRFLYENFVKWLCGDETMQALDINTKKVTKGKMNKGIYIAGPTGTGKSVCMEVMRAFAYSQKFNIQYGDLKRYIMWSNMTAKRIVTEFVKTSSIHEFANMHILCIDDLGSEPTEAVSMGNRMNVLQNVIEERGEHANFLTLITSNYPLPHAKLNSLYGERTTQRLQAMCNYFELTGKSRRV